MTEAGKYALDRPGVSCDFASHGCTKLASGHGGFDEHHRWPKSLGGPENQDDLAVLCPLHHARQHSLVRYLVENARPDQEVLKHFTAPEVSMARYAVTQWALAGHPPIAGWSRPAARA